MVASYPGLNPRVWQYPGSGTSWTVLTGPNTNVSYITVDVTGLYMYAANDGGTYHTWKYTGTPFDWTIVS